MPLMGRILSSFTVILSASLHFTIPAVAQESIRVGIVAPLSGPFGFYGEALVRGAKAATDNIGSGGTLGRKLELVVLDDGGMPPNAAQHARTLVDAMGVRFVIGPLTRTTSLAAAPIYSERKILHLEPYGSRVPSDGPPASVSRFSLCGGENARGEVLKNYLTKQLKVNRVGVVGEEDDASRFAVSRLTEVLGKLGLDVVGSEASDSRSLQGSVNRVESRNAQAIVVQFNNESYRSKLEDLSHVSTKLPIVLDVTPNVSAGYIPSAGVSNTSKVFLLQEIDQGVGLAQPPSDLAAFRKASTHAGNSFLLGYAAVQVITKGIEGARSLESERVAEWLHSGQVSPTILGEVKFNKSGEASIPQFAIYGFGKGQLRPDGTEVSCDTGCPCKDGGCGCECKK
jgi:branched-chain amino acid transport system substrate-binding protein